MNCKQLETLVAAYADGEVDALRSYSVKRHLHACAGCAATHRNINRLVKLYIRRLLDNVNGCIDRINL